MSDIKEYKCPACGGEMVFDGKTQKMKCPFCYTELDVSEFEEDEQEEQKQSSGESQKIEWEASGNGEWQENETADMNVYHCDSCGGEIIADKSTGATSCPFCGNKVVMKGQFSGDLKPDYIIPFKLDKKDAKAAYLKHLTGKPFLPKIFRQENHIDEIKGVYVPFWLFDAQADADITYKAERTRTWRSGNTEYTEHEYYNAYRSGTIEFEHIPADGSEKMDDTLMESIEPFEFKDAVPFKSAYLSGYMADRYDVGVEDRKVRAQERITKSAEENFQATVQGYHSVSPISSSVRLKNTKYWYVMYPVWMLNTTWRNKKYVFAMNGQTGKMVGDLPADNKAFWKFVTITGLALGVVIYGLMWLLV